MICGYPYFRKHPYLFGFNTPFTADLPFLFPYSIHDFQPIFSIIFIWVNFITTSLFSLTGNHWWIREIIPKWPTYSGSWSIGKFTQNKFQSSMTLDIIILIHHIIHGKFTQESSCFMLFSTGFRLGFPWPENSRRGGTERPWAVGTAATWSRPSSQNSVEPMVCRWLGIIMIE